MHPAVAFIRHTLGSVEPDLGRLAVLLDDLAGNGTGVSIKPVLELRRVIGGLETGTHANVVAAWTVSFETPNGSFEYRGETVATAVAAAFGDQSSWR
jgi:hypothetical protein